MRVEQLIVKVEQPIVKVEAALKCPVCGGSMVLRNSKYGLFYGCSNFPRCKAAHGCHDDGTPYGKPADKPTKELRILAHKYFDTLWQYSGMTRKEAYKWMRKAMKMTYKEAHIGNFDKKQCIELIEQVKERGI